MKICTGLWMSIFLTACGNGSLFTIEVEESSTVEIESAGPLGEVAELVGNLGFDGFTEMNIVESEELANQGVSPGDIEQAQVAYFALTVEEPADGDLSFINAMDIFVESDGLPTEMVASQSDFSSNVVVFELNDLDLTEYIISESVTITTDVNGSLPSENTTVRADITISVGVTAQGAKNAAAQ